MRLPTILVFVAFVSLFTLAPPQSLAQSAEILHSGEDSNLRGLSVSTANNQKIFWATGSNGVILRSPDAGKSWTRIHIDNTDSADFRGVQSFGANIAYVFSVGNDNKSHIYKTSDAGKSWSTQYSDPRPAFFLDALACHSEKICLAIGDPINGKFPILHTEDGEHWAELPQTSEPAALPTEGLFAASNSSLIFCGPNQHDIFFATGGPAARVFRSTNNTRTWSVVETPILSGNPSAGIFSIACDDQTVVAVGGDYRNPTAAKSVAAYSNDSGSTWHLSDQPPAGFRSAVTPAGSSTWIAVGTTGADISTDNAAHWAPLNHENANAILALGSHQFLTAGPKSTITLLRPFKVTP